MIDFTSYVLPCCESCQELVQAKLDIKKLNEEHKLLTEQLHANTEVLHRFNLNNEKPSIINEAFEGLEILMSAIKNELAIINKSSSLAGSVATIKNHITTVLDIVAQKNNDYLTNTLTSFKSDVSTELRNINDDLCQINQLQLDMAATTSASMNPNLFVDIVDELKAWSANILSTKSIEPLTHEAYPSLEVEMEKSEDTSGWRLLGDKKIWKADWTSYDARKMHRERQQKLAEKAKQKRKRRNRLPQNTQQPARSKYMNKSHPRPTTVNGRNYNEPSYNRCSIIHQRNTSRNCYNRSNTNAAGDIDFRTNTPLLDRELLAAAKERFSRPPPTSYRPTIAFQRGEVLNPYPSDRQPNTPHRTNAAPARLNGRCSCQCFCQN